MFRSLLDFGRPGKGKEKRGVCCRLCHGVDICPTGAGEGDDNSHTRAIESRYGQYQYIAIEEDREGLREGEKAIE